MDVVINDFQPRPISVLDRQMQTVTIALFSSRGFRRARIKFFNRKEAAAMMFDDDEAPAGTIFSDPFDIEELKHAQVSHQIAFELQKQVRNAGALISIDVNIVDENNRDLSLTRTIAASIAAY